MLSLLSDHCWHQMRPLPQGPWSWLGCIIICWCSAWKSKSPETRSALPGRVDQLLLNSLCAVIAKEYTRSWKIYALLQLKVKLFPAFSQEFSQLISLLILGLFLQEEFTVFSHFLSYFSVLYLCDSTNFFQLFDSFFYVRMLKCIPVVLFSLPDAELIELICFSTMPSCLDHQVSTVSHCSTLCLPSSGCLASFFLGCSFPISCKV